MKKKKIECKTCGAKKLTIGFCSDNTLRIYCAKCGHPLVVYYNVEPIIEDKIGDGVVVTFNYKRWEEDDE